LTQISENRRCFPLTHYLNSGVLKNFFNSMIFFLGLAAGKAEQDEATFFKGWNLGGPALVVQGNAWEAGESPGIKLQGRFMENQAVALSPQAPLAMSTMLRSSLYGQIKAEIGSLEQGDYQACVYVWEDNNSETFDVLVNGEVHAKNVVSGILGTWQRLGPFSIKNTNRLEITTRGGTANVSGIEIFRGLGTLPEPKFGYNEHPSADQLAFFEKRIRPILVTHCYECHSAKSKKLGGGLLIDSKQGIRKGGDTEPPLLPLDPASSLLLRAVRHASASLTMPPEEKLSEMDIADLEQWIRDGAPDPREEDTLKQLQLAQEALTAKAREWWAFQPLATGQRGPHAIDEMLEEKIREIGLIPALPADKRSWLRRATYDLIGLPPTLREIQDFLTDESDEAYTKVIDRLLASPHYGERWGRYWLDVARYADTAGDNSDFPIPQHYRYRNWVIQAFNDDLPYDQFITQQLAGDLLPAKTHEQKASLIIATGYLANARRFGSRVVDYPQHLTIEDTLDNLGRAFMGLSLSCARCHDHKFDPISTEEYYSLYGFFANTRYPWPGIELDQKQRDFVPLVTEQERQAFENNKTREMNALRAEKACYDHAKVKADDLEARLAEWTLKQPTNAYAVSESGQSRNVRVQHKGDPAKPKQIAKRRFPSVLGGQELPSDEKTSGRLALASWITDKNNPLTARVMVNRIWQGHFGNPIVTTPNDFGRQGKPPTHPELLDWLASEFQRSGWSVKHMHRLIMQSKAYQRSSMADAAALEKDPTNAYLSHFPRQRLDAEALRDTLLMLGGSLEKGMGGEHPFPPPNTWKFTQHNPFKAVYESSKRSVYLMTQRIQRHPYFVNFDGADPSASTALRTKSTTPLQALFFLNDPLIHEQSSRLARQLIKDLPDPRQRLESAWELLFARKPDPEELDAALQFTAQKQSQSAASGISAEKAELEAWVAQVRVLMRLNEFLYLD
jgi:hypothetical protein